jgi:hypothetical protein
MRRNLGKEMINLAVEADLFILRSDFLHTVKFYDKGPPFLIPLRSKFPEIFIALKNPSLMLGLN